ncbi:MAG: alpha/beta fold hydrolase [Alphaproteobacteria bacterium]|nr:alpha/beta fold hydrolase [Alphaproteobacteria bacterium]
MVRLLVAALALLAAGCASAPPPLTGGGFVQTRGGDIYVRDWGDASGPPVLLIHGTTSQLEDWDVALGTEFTSKYRLIAYDRPGMGRSTHRPADAAKLAVQGDTAADVIRAEHPGGKVVVVGHSYGGAVALRLALDHPDLVAGLVLLAPASHPWGGGAPFFYKLESAPVIGEIVTTLAWPFSGPAARASLKNRTFAPRPVPPGYFEKADVKLALRPAALRATAADFVALPKELEAQAKRYGELTMPIEVIQGEADRIVPVRLVRQKSAFSHGRVVFVPGAGHMVQHAAQPQIDEAIGWVLSEAAKPD